MKKKGIAIVLVLALLCTPSVANATVIDSTGNYSVQKIMGKDGSTDTSTVFGLLQSIFTKIGSENVIASKDSFSNASINARLNYLNNQMQDLKQICE